MLLTQKQGYMNVIDVREHDNSGIIALCRQQLGEKYNINVSTLHPSSFSFITSTRMANELKKTQASVLIVDRLKDAVAAVSARKLLPKNNAGYKIIYTVSSLAHMPTGVPTEVCRGIDCWVFDSEIAENAYSNHEFIEVHRAVIIPPTTSLNFNVVRHHEQRESLHITVVGDLTDCDRLQRIVRSVAACSRHKVELHVYGTGKPRYIMPVVNEARHLDGLSVVWHGSSYDLKSVIADTDIAVGAFKVPDNVDIFMRSLGIPVVEPEKIAETVASQESLDEASANSLNDFKTIYNLDFHVAQWHNLLQDLC
jgi:hypothetical protein